MPATYDLAVHAVRSLYDRRIEAPPVLDQATYFPEGVRFAARWCAIRDEAIAVGRDLLAIPRFHELVPAQEDISANDDRDWRMFVLKAYGVTARANLARCPVLAGILAGCPDVLSASFSFLAPGKHVSCHRGPFRGIVRYHLGLDAPADASGLPGTVLRVAGVDHRLADGDSLLWDDTYPHEVANHAPAVRVALLLDVRRRGMPLDLRLVSRAMVGAIGVAVRWRRFVGCTPGLA